MEADATTILHASSVAWDGRAVVIVGPSGSGKSGLALELMAFGCDLISDDGTRISERAGELFVTAPETIRGWIEARGVGVLAAAHVASARLRLVVDLGQIETERLPEPRRMEILDCPVPLLHRCESAHFPAAILQYLKGGRAA